MLGHIHHEKKRQAGEAHQPSEAHTTFHIPRIMLPRVALPTFHFSRRKKRFTERIREEDARIRKREERVKKRLEAVKQREKLRKLKQQHKEVKRKYDRHAFEQYMRKAGLDWKAEQAYAFTRRLSLWLTLLAFLVMNAWLFFQQQLTPAYFFKLLLIFLFIILPGMYLLVLFAFHEYLDLRMYKRKKEVENVLADFLFLTAANIRSGMTIDNALWHAVRPRFGVLAREVEDVAKRVLSGEDLDTALRDFAEKYDSMLLKRSISLLIEGVNAGGEMASLLTNIALDIQETQLMRKEMAANVSTYAIFINFAALGAAPFLFALAGEILKTIKRLGEHIQIDPTVMRQSTFNFSFNPSNGIAYHDFFIFALIMLSITTIMSQVIVTTIRKGSARDALLTIPLYVTLVITLFLLASWAIGGFLKSII